VNLKPALVYLAINAALVAPLTPAESRSTQDAVFNQTQAERGARLAAKHCVQCHDVGYFTGVFLQSWQNQPIQGLFDLIRATMPEDRPGALKERQYTDLLAYIFSLNDLPVGDKKLDYKNGNLKTVLIRLNQSKMQGGISPNLP